MRGSIAYEYRTRAEDQQNNFLRNSAGELIFDRRVDVDGEVYDTYSYGRSRLQQRTQQRDSLLVGAGISAELGNGWASGGKASKSALFLHYGYALSEQWD